jgi:hypothetical protein
MKLSQAQAIVEKAITHALDLKDARDAQYVVPYLIGGAGLGKTTIVWRTGWLACPLEGWHQHDPHAARLDAD